MSNHKWTIAWDKDSDSAIHKCEKCGIKKRKRFLFARGTLMRKGAMDEYLVDGKWIDLKDENSDKIKCIIKNGLSNPL